MVWVLNLKLSPFDLYNTGLSSSEKGNGKTHVSGINLIKRRKHNYCDSGICETYIYDIKRSVFYFKVAKFSFLNIRNKIFIFVIKTTRNVVSSLLETT